MKKRKAPRVTAPPTLVMVTVCFSAKTVNIDGRTYTVPPESDCFAFPILSGDRPVLHRGWLA